MEQMLNSQAKRLQQGAIRAMFEKAAAYSNTINLGIGEPDMATPEVIVSAGCEALKSGHTHYTPNAGIPELRREVAESLKKEGIHRNPDSEILITSGGMGALSLALMVLLEQGDEVLIQDPQWLNYYAQVTFFGGVPIPVPVEEINDFRITAKAIEQSVTPRTKVLMLNSPNNPTGAVLDREDLEAIAKVAVKHNLIVLSDEVYSTLVYDEARHISIATLEGMQERTVVINSFSKAFAMTGWRVGYAAGNRHIIDKMIRLQENLVACVNSAAQYAAITALQHPELAEEMQKGYREKRDLVVDGLNRIKGLSCIRPRGSFYVFANIQEVGMDEITFANELLEKQQVVLIPGSAFGDKGKGYVRISYANSVENLTDALARIDRYTSEK